MDPNSAEFKSAVLELRARAGTESAALDAQLKNALDPQYWRELNPGMAICGREPFGPAEDPDAKAAVAKPAVQMLSTSGYFQIPALGAAPAIEQMRRCFELTRDA